MRTNTIVFHFTPLAVPTQNLNRIGVVVGDDPLKERYGRVPMNVFAHVVPIVIHMVESQEFICRLATTRANRSISVVDLFLKAEVAFFLFSDAISSKFSEFFRGHPVKSLIILFNG